jgi:hypothetical protein
MAGPMPGVFGQVGVGMVDATLRIMWRWCALLSGLVAIACGGITSEDPSQRTGQSSSQPDAVSDDGAAGAAGTYGGELPATCGEWLEAVSDATDRCGTFLYLVEDYDEDRALSPELAREVCMPALTETDCSSDVHGYMPDECKDACR